MADNTSMSGKPPSNDVNRNLAIQFGMPVYDDLSSFRLPRELIKKIPYAFAKKTLLFLSRKKKALYGWQWPIRCIWRR